MNQFEGIHPEIINKLRTSGNFTDEEIIEALSYFEKRTVRRKEFFLRAGDICRTKGYINKGCFKRYTIDDHGKEIIINFAFEEWMIGDLESFNTHQPTIYFVQALEDSEVLCISEENHLTLCEVMPKYHAFHKRKAESSHYATLKRLTSFQSKTPEEKYLSLIQKYPQLFQRVPLHYIASYLGIEPESLSRLRKRLCKKEKKS
ncbi:MAG: Crp/Fnr family transcriptional regulator [Bacteroidota bacterium]|nr:Crp/Fnr family transcriptional regulator [Bacteroidota bacterium]